MLNKIMKKLKRLVKTVKIKVNSNLYDVEPIDLKLPRKSVKSIQIPKERLYNTNVHLPNQHLNSYLTDSSKDTITMEEMIIGLELKNHFE